MKIRNKFFRALIIIFLLLTFLFSAAIFYLAFSLNSQNSYGCDNFNNQLKSIYAEYDTHRMYESAKTFALKRLIVSRYITKTYSASAVAADKKHGYTVLQYDTEADAQKAYNKIKGDNIPVEPDCSVSLNAYEKCEMDSDASQKLGIDTYISNYKMAKEDVVVAVIDTSVMQSHPELEGRFVNAGYDLTGEQCDNADFNFNYSAKAYFHSTFVCGIIANNTPDNVKILPYKVFEEKSGDASASTVVAAINDAVDNGADVINLSLASTNGADAYKKAVDNATENGVCVVACAGNYSTDAASYYPAACENSITVSALNSTFEKIASYSNYGTCIDFCAPGSKITSSVITDSGEAGYETYSGTSFSCPYVAAMCADIKSMNKNLSVDDVYKILSDFAVDYGDTGFDSYYGYGMPVISDIVYTDSLSYTYKLPQGTLEITDSTDFTANSQPWKAFADKIISVNVSASVESIGSYAFYNMQSASFSLPQPLLTVGDYAFYGCGKLSEITFSQDVTYIGEGAFENCPLLVINGYQNTVAQTYTSENKISFNSLGCKHNYFIEITQPSSDSDGSTLYTCSVCGYSYTGEYIQASTVSSGQCGENAEYSLNNIGTLTISGSGDMYDYSRLESPWNGYAKDIKSIIISQDITGVSPFAFYGCANIISCKSYSPSFTTVNNSLCSADGSTLIIAVKNSSGGFTVPESINNLCATAFLPLCEGFALTVNDNYTLSQSLVYDLNGNIVMALPSYKSSVLTINSDIDIKDYAFILTSFPESVRNYSLTSSFGAYSIGFTFENGGFVKNDLSYYGYIDPPAYTYCKDNEFNLNLINAGSCGENITWHYNTETYTLTLSGNGAMYTYSTKNAVAWYDYMQEIKTVVIDNGITELSPYSFFGCINLESLSLPLSLSAPASSSIWYNCCNIKTLNLTLGSGSMPDYGTTNSSKIYTYSPWYISRESITSFSIDSGALRIGAYAFRSFTAAKSLSLNDCEYIGKYAFYDCINLTDITIYSKNITISTNSLASCSSGNDISTIISGYSDCAVHDYCTKNGKTFNSIGCGHSRSVTAKGDRAQCCYDSTVNYYCSDCGELTGSEYLKAQSTGHYVKGCLKTAAGNPIPGALVYFDGELAAVTNSFGFFVLDNVLCEIDHKIEIKKHDALIAETTVNTNMKNRSGTVQITYGDFIDDNIVNVKDYAYAHIQGWEDINIFDYGRVENENVNISTAYSTQTVPYAMNFYNEECTDSDYKRRFNIEAIFGKEYTVTEGGFIYGKNMKDSDMTVENIGTVNSDGYTLKVMSQSFTDDVYTKITASFNYGSSSKSGTVSARFYIKYTNGVKTYIAYSDVSSYTY